MLHCAVFLWMPLETQGTWQKQLISHVPSRALKVGFVFHVAQLLCLTISLLHLAALSNIIILPSAKEQILLYIFECVLCSSELCQLRFTKTE